ncbi:MAG: hypothetical protein MI864_24515, partial [Pseudomonadales bacterium]|nr:hypothetical protein [Pseudomonadales bacterium]
MNLYPKLSSGLIYSALMVIALTSSLHSVADTATNRSTQVAAAPVSGTQSLNALLQEVRKQVSTDQQLETSRLQQFKTDHENQALKLANAEARLREAERRQRDLQAQFDANEIELGERQTTLESRSGQLGEVFGVVKQQAKDFSGVLQTSLISAQYPSRHEALAFSNNDRIPTIDDLQTLWLLLQQEMTASAEMTYFESSVANSNGQMKNERVLRLGAFNTINSDGEYLNYIPDQQQLHIYAKQPDIQFVNLAQSFYRGASDTLL